MAPFIGPSKQDVLHLLRQHRYQAQLLPDITLGKYQPQFIIRLHQQRYELIPLTLDEARAAQDAECKSNEGYYVPEMVWASLVSGSPVIQESSIDVFIKLLDAWPGWVQLM